MVCYCWLECLCKRECYVHCDNHTFYEFDFPFETSKKGNQKFRIVATCNGLVFVSSLPNQGIMALWNPSLRKLVTLPKPSIIHKSCAYCNIGFGIDPITNDYKVIRITYFFSCTVVEVELFELSTGSWRNINASDFPNVVMPSPHLAFLNSVVHWAGYSPEFKCLQHFP